MAAKYTHLNALGEIHAILPINERPNVVTPLWENGSQRRDAVERFALVMPNAGADGICVDACGAMNLPKSDSYRYYVLLVLG